MYENCLRPQRTPYYGGAATVDGLGLYKGNGMLKTAKLFINFRISFNYFFVSPHHYPQVFLFLCFVVFLSDYLSDDIFLTYLYKTANGERARDGEPVFF